MKCFPVEWSYDYHGKGYYDGDISIAFIPFKVLEKNKGDVKAAFIEYTGIPAIHILHYNFEEFYFEDGSDYKDI